MAFAFVHWLYYGVNIDYNECPPVDVVCTSVVSFILDIAYVLIFNA